MSQLFAPPWTAACQTSLSFTSNSCPLSQWCYLTTSSSAIPSSFCLQFFSASESFPMSQLFASGGQSIGASASALTMNILGTLLWIFNENYFPTYKIYIALIRNQVYVPSFYSKIRTVTNTMTEAIQTHVPALKELATSFREILTLLNTL